MHDIDRVLLEQPGADQEGEEEQFLFEDELHEQEGEQFFEQEDEFEGGQHEHALGETQEVELANQVLEVGSEQELEQFLGGLLRVVGDQAGRFARSKTGRQLGGILKHAAVQALPVVARAVGAGGGRPGRGLADAARCFGLQQEAMSGEDREFELARHFIRFADCATRQAVRRFNSAPPSEVAKRAATAAARRHAPGMPLPRILGAPPLKRLAATSVAAPSPARAALATPRPATPGGTGTRQAAATTGGARCRACGSPLTTTSGRWVLRGNTVVLLPD